MKSISEIVNLFVDGEITAHEQAQQVIADNGATPEIVLATITRLIPSSRANQFRKIIENIKEND